ncbi:MAG: hypothetical protein RBT19_01545 [Tenuifilaceae bacterium]|jgi:hypothetical protein|nr:hypothetical protein [Tenuifilaceae bacterium]
MKAKHFLAIFFVLTLFSAEAKAQHTYNTGVGLRGGYPSGVTVKQFLTSNTAAEGIVSFGWGGIGITGLYQIHNRIPDAPGFEWYYGGGAHLATAKADDNSPFAGSMGGELFLGVDGIIGVEYVFESAPISLSLDILPILNIVNDIGVWFNSGLSIRYTFK